MKYLAVLFTLSISTLSTHFYLSNSTDEVSNKQNSMTELVDLSPALLLQGPSHEVTEQTAPTVSVSLPETGIEVELPHSMMLTLQQSGLPPNPNAYLQAPQVPEHTNCDCQKCAATVPHPFVQWVDKEVTLCATVYEVEETAEPFCDCIEKNGQCETIVGVQNVRRLVPRKRKWVQTIKYPQIVYFDRPTPLKCGTTVRECPEVPKPPVPGNAGERSPFGGPVNQAPPAGTNVPLRRIEG